MNTQECKQNWRMSEMLKKFEVQNFKGFKEKLVFDLAARDYVFNKTLIQNNIVNKAIVYGKNGVGKSCLGIALFDIVSHLTDKERMPSKYLVNYLNLESNKKVATFKYYFQFVEDEIIYEYDKVDQNNLVQEKLTVNGKLVLFYNYFNQENNYIDKELIGELNVYLLDNKLSIIKYIYRNTPSNTAPILRKMVEFCENMLWYRSLSDGNAYSGFTNGAGILTERLYESGKINEFQKFLEDNGLYYKLNFINANGMHELVVEYPNRKPTPFTSIASTGTMALFLFFTWRISFNKISLLFIDEFDAFFHFESAKNIVLLLNKAINFQTILTSHNTYLMQNQLTRPDCCFIMTENKISSLFNATDKELREAHNLEKMYINGAFNE